MKRGGMCHNPFGGLGRLDRLDFLELLPAGVPTEKALFLQTITDAVHNYLFFGLGRNGTTAEEFAYACEYLFHVRSTDPASWRDARTLTVVAEDDGPGHHRSAISLELSDGQLISGCFDRHYQYAGLDQHMSMDRFLRWLQERRRHILQENESQVLEFLNALYWQACKQAKPGHQLPLPTHERIEMLVHPRSPLDVARLVFLPKKYLSKPLSRRQACRA